MIPSQRFKYPVLAAGMVEEAILFRQNPILSDSAFSRMAEFD
jgi:hypothetical protein